MFSLPNHSSFQPEPVWFICTPWTNANHQGKASLAALEDEVTLPINTLRESRNLNKTWVWQ